MEFSVLGSGSKGNAYLLREKDTLILIDTGFSSREIQKRMNKLSVDPKKITAILITHEHWDHIKGLENFLKYFQIPVYLSQGTLNSINFPLNSEINIIKGGQEFQIGEVLISPFEVPHDASEPMGFCFFNGNKKIGFASDLGKVTFLVLEKLKNVNLLALETNHDEDLLKNGPYPHDLKARIKSVFGHLSNRDAVCAMKDLISKNLKYILPIHLSEVNNTPDLVKYYVEEVLRINLTLNINCIVATQRETIPFLEV